MTERGIRLLFKKMKTKHQVSTYICLNFKIYHKITVICVYLKNIGYCRFLTVLVYKQGDPNPNAVIFRNDDLIIRLNEILFRFIEIIDFFCYEIIIVIEMLFRNYVMIFRKYEYHDVTLGAPQYHTKLSNFHYFTLNGFVYA